MIITYRYKLLPSKRQHAALAEILEAQRLLYNAALEERIGCYRATGKGRSYIDQCKALTVWRQGDPEAAAFPLKLQRWTLKRLDDAYQAFFRRVKVRKTGAGFPRFRGTGWWNSFGFNEFSGIRFDGNRLRWRGLPGGLRIHLHRPLPDDADIRSCVFTKMDRIWHVCLQVNTAVAGRGADNETECGERWPDHLARACESQPGAFPSPAARPSVDGSCQAKIGETDHLARACESQPTSSARWPSRMSDHLAPARKSQPTGPVRSVGLDLGLNVFAYLSDGGVIPTPKFSRKAHRELRRRARALARCRRGSNRRRKVRARLARLHRKISDTRATWLHQQSAKLTQTYNLIAVEDLKIKNMVRSAKGTVEQSGKNVAAKSGLNRSIADASWAKFLSMLAYKAERAGKQLVRVDPRNTSRRCSGCHQLVPKSLAVRTHSCPHCGLVIDRDWNASLNILAAVVGRALGNVA